MKTEEIRRAFLDYFISKGHTEVVSSSLIPAGDPTLLFVNSGMVQFKDCFLGAEKRNYTRATTCQKSLRISGKHNDLENVGRTARHHTFFEMLGNFSFGDYFKEDAIKFAWEFLTQTLKLPKNRLWVTIFENDDDAELLWKNNTDLLPGRVLRCGEKDNFWAMGDTGPCGPCSEIHYYLGDDIDNQSEAEFRKEDGTYIEIWNLVFMQFNRDPSGKLNPLPKPSVDTGMGLERVASIKQGCRSNYDADLLRGIISLTEKMSSKKYDGSDYRERNPEEDPQYAIDVAMRVIADHSRACTFLIADGINPSSDGRGYVLRRLIRRACRHGRNIGFKEPFLYKVAAYVIEAMSGTYPEIKKSAATIEKVLKAEEEKFLDTLDTGLAILNKEVTELKKSAGKILSGSLAFSLHDTYGFPLDLTEDLARIQGFTVDTVAFAEQMDAQRARSRQARASDLELVLQRVVKPHKTKFVGYEFTEYESNIVGLFGKEGEVKSAKEGEEVALVVSETPFYGESGGQIGDTGSISTNSALVDVVDTQKVGGDTFVHLCRVVEGAIQPGDKVRLAVEQTRRQRLRVNHSATHLLHLALREVLGDHVKQAGSRVSDESLRFDFSHFEPISSSQLEEIEAIVNAEVRSNHQVVTEVLPIEEAKKSGAVALFGEKYGDFVRVVQIGSRSREFCGGTHASRSGDLGFVKVTNEGSISAGVRRIEAVAGIGAFKQIMKQREILQQLLSTLRTNESELVDRVEKVLSRNIELEREVEKLSSVLNMAQSGDLTSSAVVLKDGTKVVASVIEKATPKQLREVADDLKSRLGSGCIALASVSDGKAIVLTAVTEDLIKKYHAGNLMKELNKVVGGQGGGRADLAQAGGGDPEKILLGLDKFRELVS